MAKVTLQIIAQVLNQATGPLRSVNQSLKETSATAKKAEFSFNDLNRTLFYTKSYFSMMGRAFRDFRVDLSQSANLQRIETSFHSVFGPNSDILKSVSDFSSIAIDRTEAMKNAIALGTLGFAKTSSQAAEILVGAAEGASQAGVDTTSAMDKIVQSLKDGSLSSLEFLNQLKSNDAGLKLTLSNLNKYSGALGSAVTAQFKQNLIMKTVIELARVARYHQEDLVDTLQHLDNALSHLKQTIGVFIGKAFGPMLKYVKDGATYLTEFFKENSKNSGGLINLAKNLGIATLALGGFYTALNTVFLIQKLLSTAAVGFPFLKMGVLGLATAFLLTTNNTEGVINKLKLFGDVIEGVVQLVSTLDPSTGISKINVELKKTLEENGVFKLVQNIARGISFMTAVVKETINVFQDWSNKAMGFINPVIDLIGKLFGMDSGPWSKNLVNGTSNVTKTLGKLLAGYIAFKALKPIIWGPLKSLLGIGAKTGGTGVLGGAPMGSPHNPMYVIVVGGGVGGGLLGGLPPREFPMPEKGEEAAAKTIFGKLAIAVSGIISSLRNVFLTLARGIGPAFLAGLAGYEAGSKLMEVTKGTKFGGALEATGAGIADSIAYIADKMGMTIPGSVQDERREAEARKKEVSPPTFLQGVTSLAGIVDSGELTGTVPTLSSALSGPGLEAAQLQTLQATQLQLTNVDEKGQMLKAIREFLEARKAHDVKAEAEIFAKAYAHEIKKDKPPQHQVSRRGC